MTQDERKFAERYRTMCKKFCVTITETLRRTITVAADDHAQAEQMVSDGWHNSKYILGSEDFVDVEFEAKPVADGGTANENSGSRAWA